jgi:anti-sigma B factor antagonist
MRNAKENADLTAYQAHMDFHFSQQDGIGVLSLSGSLIGETDGLPVLEAFGDQLSQGITRYVIDMTHLNHINSTGLGMLITLLTRARKAGGEVVLANPSGFIQNLLVITKLHTIFSTFPDADAALAQLNAGA